MRVAEEARLPNYLPDYQIIQQVAGALAEDLNCQPDLTAQLIATNKLSNAYIQTYQDMILCGKRWVEIAFQLLDHQVAIKWHFAEGALVSAGSQLCKIKGDSQALLSAERTALNFLQLLSATATRTRTYVEKVCGTSTKIMDTRKTIPGLRLAQKYAVTVGGGYNQRLGLFDGVLIKENHIIAHGSIANALIYARQTTPRDIPIQIEVETLSELTKAVAAGATLILLDNFSIAQVTECVKFCTTTNQKNSTAKIILEASGNINLTNVRNYALCGVDRISLGDLTKNIQAIDLSMRFQDDQ